MTGTLLVPYGLAGHTGPMAVLGTALRDSGHRVTVLVPESLAPEFRDRGLATRAPRLWRADAPVPAELLASGDTGAVLRHLTLGSVADLTADVAEALDATGSDVVVADVFMPGAGIAADRAGRPWASIACSPVPAVDSYTVFIPAPLRPYFDATLGRVSPYLHLIPTTPRFAGHPRLPGQVRLCGPLIPGVRGRPTPRPGSPAVVVAPSSHVWVRLGDGARRQQRALRTAVRGLRGLNLTAVVILPPGTDAELAGPVPDTVRYTAVVSSDEFDDLLDGCTAVVTHGGWGSVCRALVRGRPLVVMPTSIDQPYVAERCAELGLGIALDPLTATPADFRAAVHEVCADPAYRRAAADFATELRAAAPLETASSLVANLVTANLSGTKG